MLDNGFVIVDRAVISMLAEKTPLHAKLFLWLLARARFRNGRLLRRGQLISSIDEMRNAMAYNVGYRKCRPTKDQVRKCYEGFVRASLITTKKTTRGMVITICDFDKYSDNGDSEPHSEPHGESASNPIVTPHNRRKRKEKRRNKEKGTPLIPPLPDWLNRDLWADFIEHRKALRKPLKTQKAIALNINRLEELIAKGHNQAEIINLAIERGWQSFYPPKQNLPSNKSRSACRTQNNIMAINRAKDLIR